MASHWFPGNGKHLSDPFSGVCVGVATLARRVVTLAADGQTNAGAADDSMSSAAGDSALEDNNLQHPSPAAPSPPPAAAPHPAPTCSAFVAQFVRGEPINSEPSATEHNVPAGSASGWRLRNAACTMQHAAIPHTPCGRRQLVRVLLWQRDV